jgi:hypothetical protein
MGHRANLVIVDEKEYHLYYCHWCALTIPRDLFWGPEWALGFIAQQESVATNAWLDNIWAEGGALVDIHAKVVLLWGLSAVGALPYRRIYLELMREVWQGWSVRWASQEIYDLADYVKLDREEVTSRVLSDEENDNIWISRLLTLNEIEEVTIVGSVRWEDERLQLVPIAGWSRFLTKGDSILEEIHAHPWIETLDLTATPTDRLPHIGFHVDVARRQLVIWASSAPHLETIRTAWAGWEVRWLDDDFSYHLSVTDGHLTLPIPDIETILSDIESDLLSPQRNTGLELMTMLTGVLSDEGKSVDVNPSALKETAQSTPDEVRRAIFDRALAAWRAKQA